MASNERGAENVRLDTARALTQILRHQRTIEWIRTERPQWLTTSLHIEFLYGTLRHYLSLKSSVDAKLKRPLKAKDLDIYHLLLVGIYQLKYTGIAEHAAINECVSACHGLGKPWAKGLINAILRSEQRDISAVDSAFVAQTDHPNWLRDLLVEQYGESANRLMQANNERAPMTLRINQRAIGTDEYKAQLTHAGISYQDGPWPEALTLTKPCSAVELPGWADGHCAVQDLASQHAAHVLLKVLPEILPGEKALTILDACAAPGGKLFHVKESLVARALPHRLFAMDIKSARLGEMAAIAERLGHTTSGISNERSAPTDAITLVNADGSAATLPFDQKFDAVLIDAPCTGSGTIRRNPDIRLLLAPAVLLEQQQLQQRLLQNLWQHVRPGGTLVYSTCSVFAEENDQVILSFLGKNDDACVETPRLTFGHATQFGWQLLPTETRTDGFFYCALKKSPSTKPLGAQ